MVNIYLKGHGFVWSRIWRYFTLIAPLKFYVREGVMLSGEGIANLIDNDAFGWNVHEKHKVAGAAAAPAGAPSPVHLSLAERLAQKKTQLAPSVDQLVFTTGKDYYDEPLINSGETIREYLIYTDDESTKDDLKNNNTAIGKNASCQLYNQYLNRPDHLITDIKLDHNFGILKKLNNDKYIYMTENNTLTCLSDIQYFLNLKLQSLNINNYKLHWCACRQNIVDGTTLQEVVASLNGNLTYAPSQNKKTTIASDIVKLLHKRRSGTDA